MPAAASDEPKESALEEGVEEHQKQGENLEPWPTLEEVKKKFATSKQYVDLNFRQMWDDAYALYKRRRVMRHYEGISDPVIPEAFTILETLVAQIAGGDLSWHFQRTNEEQPEDPVILNGAVDYYTSCNQMGLKTQEWVREMLREGTSVMHVPWQDGKPFFDNVPIRDFFVDANATAMRSSGKPVARYAGHLYLASNNVLKNAKIFDADKQEWVPKYENLEKVGLFSPNEPSGWGKFMDKFYKDMFNGSPLGADAMNEQTLVCLMYDLDSGSVTELGNFNQIIYQDEIQLQREEKTRTVKVPMPDGTVQEVEQTLDKIDAFIPYAVLRDYIDTSLFYGEGEMAVIMDRAEMLNDLEAMDTDNIAYQNTPMYQIDPQFADLAPEIETIPGAVYPIPKGALSPLERPQLGQDLDIKKDRVVQQMRSATAADEAVQGISQSKGRTTATEVSTEIGQAQNRFSTKIKNIEDSLADLGSIIYKEMQIFLPEATTVRMQSPKGTKFGEYDPWEHNGEWEPHVELDVTTKRKQMEVGQKNNQMFQVLDAHASLFDPVELARFEAQTINPDLTDERFNAMLAKQQPGPSSEEQKMAADVQKAELGAVATIYRWANPFVQSQIETILHMQPDPMHEEEENTNAITHGAKQADLLNPLTNSDNQAEPNLPQAQPPVIPDGMPALQPAGAPA